MHGDVLDKPAVQLPQSGVVRLQFYHLLVGSIYRRGQSGKVCDLWGGPDSADGVEFMISSSFTLDLDPFFTAMQSAAYAAEGLR